MDASGDESFVMEEKSLSSDTTLQNSEWSDVMDSTLKAESRDWSFLTDDLQAKETSIDTVNVVAENGGNNAFSDDELKEKAQEILNDVIDSVLRSLSSSGDFSLSNDGEKMTPKAGPGPELNEENNRLMKDETISNHQKPVLDEKEQIPSEEGMLQEPDEKEATAEIKPVSINGEKAIPDEKGPITDNRRVTFDEKKSYSDEKNSISDDKKVTFNDEKTLTDEEKLIADEKKDDEWMDILGNGLLKKKVVEKAEGENIRPERGQEVTVRIESVREDDTVLEESRTFTFVVADMDVAEAVDLSVNLMEKGEKCQVSADVKYCRPKDGRNLDLPKEGKITYIIELLDINEGPYNISVSIEKRLSWVDEKRDLGNTLYTKGLLEEAKATYGKCTKVLRQAANEDLKGEVKKKMEALTLKCNNNLAAALMKLNSWKEAFQACLAAERIDGNNVKTLFRKGQICAKLGQHSQSISVLKKAAALSPDDKTIQNELSKQQKRVAEQHEAQKRMCQRMLGSVPNTPKKEKKNEPKSWLSNSKTLLGGSLFAVGAAVLIGLYITHR